MATLESLETKLDAVITVVNAIDVKLSIKVAVLESLGHSFPCQPSQELAKRVDGLKETQDIARGGVKTGLILVGLWATIVGAVAAIIAWFK